ncbi:PapD-like protein [Endogone sp. FLAS-F59071]|nr:PapD-like protein [Endogone sp. FLAS-F59071]|eukprot:RUS14194.1 PapD-like protein [Endogone sp. FLAS-F59071]
MQAHETQLNDAALNKKAHTHVNIPKTVDTSTANNTLQVKSATALTSSRSDSSNAKQQQQQQQQQQQPAKPPQQPPVIRISPPKFQFYASRHSNGYISRLTVKNLRNNPVGFKVCLTTNSQFKTNAPLRYSVKPVLAVLQPNASLEVYVRSESPINPSDRFMIQSVSLTEDEAALTSSSTWKQIDRRRLTENFINCSMMRGSRPRSSSAESLAQPRASGASTATKNAGTDEMALSKAKTKIYQLIHAIITSHYSKIQFLIVSFICILVGLLVPLEKLVLIYGRNSEGIQL